MTKPKLVIMAAGMGSRFGGPKQITPVDDAGHVIVDFSIYDALRAGFGGVVFIVNQQKYDARYILTSLDFARKLFGYRTEVSAIELKLKPGYDTGRAQQEIQDILGDRYRVQDRYEQQADVFRIMKIEKFISYSRHDCNDPKKYIFSHNSF